MGFATATTFSSPSPSPHVSSELQQQLQFAAQNREYDKLLLVIGSTLSILRASWTAAGLWCKPNSSHGHAPWHPSCSSCSYQDASCIESALQFAENFVFSVVQLSALILLFCHKRWYARSRTYIMALLRLLEPVRVACTLKIAGIHASWGMADGVTYLSGLLPLFWRSIVYVVPMQSHFTISVLDHLCLIWILLYCGWDEMTFGVGRRIVGANVAMGTIAAVLVGCLQSRVLWAQRGYTLHGHRHWQGKGKMGANKEEEHTRTGGGVMFDSEASFQDFAYGNEARACSPTKSPGRCKLRRSASSLYRPTSASLDRQASLNAAFNAVLPTIVHSPPKSASHPCVSPPSEPKSSTHPSVALPCVSTPTVSPPTNSPSAVKSANHPAAAQQLCFLSPSEQLSVTPVTVVSKADLGSSCAEEVLDNAEPISSSTCRAQVTNELCKCEGIRTQFDRERPESSDTPLHEAWTPERSVSVRSSPTCSSSGSSKCNSSICELNMQCVEPNNLGNTMYVCEANTTEQYQTTMKQQNSSLPFCAADSAVPALNLPPVSTGAITHCGALRFCNATTDVNQSITASSAWALLNTITDVKQSTTAPDAWGPCNPNTDVKQLTNTLNISDGELPAAVNVVNACTPAVEDWDCVDAADLAVSASLMQSLLSCTDDILTGKQPASSSGSPALSAFDSCKGLSWLTAQYTAKQTQTSVETSISLPSVQPVLAPFTDVADCRLPRSRETAPGMPSIVPIAAPVAPIVASVTSTIEPAASCQPAPAVWLPELLLDQAIPLADDAWQVEMSFDAHPSLQSRLTAGDEGDCINVDSHVELEAADNANMDASEPSIDPFSAALLRACDTSNTLVDADMAGCASYVLSDLDTLACASSSDFILNVLPVSARADPITAASSCKRQATGSAAGSRGPFPSHSSAPVAHLLTNQVRSGRTGKVDDMGRKRNTAIMVAAQSGTRAGTPARARRSLAGHTQPTLLGGNVLSPRHTPASRPVQSRSSVGHTGTGGQKHVTASNPFPLALMPHWRGSTETAPGPDEGRHTELGSLHSSHATQSDMPTVSPVEHRAVVSPGSTQLCTPAAVFIEPVSAGTTLCTPAASCVQPVSLRPMPSCAPAATCTEPIRQGRQVHAPVKPSLHTAAGDEDPDMLDAAVRVAELIPMDASSASHTSLVSSSREPGLTVPPPEDEVMLQLWIRQLQSKASRGAASSLYCSKLEKSCAVVQMRYSFPKGQHTLEKLSYVGKSFIAKLRPCCSLCSLSSAYIFNQSQIFLVAHHLQSSPVASGGVYNQGELFMEAHHIQPHRLRHRLAGLSSAIAVERTAKDDSVLLPFHDSSNLMREAKCSSTKGGRENVAVEDVDTVSSRNKFVQVGFGKPVTATSQGAHLGMGCAAAQGSNTLVDARTCHEHTQAVARNIGARAAGVVGTFGVAERDCLSDEGIALMLSQRRSDLGFKPRGRASCDIRATMLDDVLPGSCHSPDGSTAVWLWPPAIPAGRAALVEVGVCTRQGVHPGLIMPGTDLDKQIGGQGGGSKRPGVAARPVYVRVVMTCKGDVLADVELTISTSTKTCRVGLPALKPLKGIDVWVLSAGKAAHVYGCTSLLVLPDESACREVRELYNTMVRTHAMEAARKLASQPCADQCTSCCPSSARMLLEQPSPCMPTTDDTIPADLLSSMPDECCARATGFQADMDYEPCSAGDQTYNGAAVRPSHSASNLSDCCKLVWMKHFTGLLQDLDLVLCSASAVATPTNLTQPLSCRLDLPQLVQVANQVFDLLCRNQAWVMSKMILARLRHTAPAVLVGMGLQTPSTIFRPLDSSAALEDHAAFQDL